MASQITTAAYGYNAKRLDSEAEECITKIWAGIRLKSQIKDHLHFLSDAVRIPLKIAIDSAPKLPAITI